MHLADVAGARRQRAAERDEILLHAAAPGARVAGRAAPATLLEQGIAVVLARGPPEQLVEALEHLGRAHLGGVDLVGHGRELVRLVDDRVREARVVGRPAQQQVVVRDHQMGLRERRPAPAEGAAPLRAHCSRVQCSARAATERRRRSRSGGKRKSSAAGSVPTSPCGRVRAQAASAA